VLHWYKAGRSAFDFESFVFYLFDLPNPISFYQVQQIHFAFDEVTHAEIEAFYSALSSDCVEHLITVGTCSIIFTIFRVLMFLLYKTVFLILDSIFQFPLTRMHLEFFANLLAVE